MSKENKNEGKDEENNIVILAGYQTIELGKNNFEQLVQLAKDKMINTEGMILVEKDKEGNVSVNETGDHLGRKGLGWGGRRRPTCRARSTTTLSICSCRCSSWLTYRQIH